MVAMTELPETRLSPFAVRSSEFGGRRHSEPVDPLRSPFELDRRRITGSTAFRRLERKTQVFTVSYHDHFRTRLTHTLEVVEVARTLALALGANEALVEAIALAHDLGHPPFGHAGESALNDALASHGGFNHNTHSLRVVDYLEHPFPEFRGLNLTRETRRGLALHETCYDQPDKTGYGFEDDPGGPGVEAQIASLADRVAVTRSDLEDAIGAGLVNLDELREVRLFADAFEKMVDAEWSIHAIRRPILDAMLDEILSSIVSASTVILSAYHSPEEVRGASDKVVVLPEGSALRLAELERFLLDRLYRGCEVAEMDAEGRRKVLALFAAYRADPEKLPARFAERVEEQGPEAVIRDYIAGMTDRFCSTAYDEFCR